METSVKTPKVLAPPQPDKDSASKDGEAAAAAASSSSNAFDAVEAFGRRLEEIIRAHGSAAGLLDKPQSLTEETKEQLKGDAAAGEILALQKKMAALLEERRSSISARCKLETLCRELQAHYNALREETLQRCREEEEKRSEITSHFQSMLTEIQTQIELHSARNDKLCSENANLTDKLESLMNQCDLREESLEKINKRRDLQQKLTEAKLQQANALLTEAEEKHKREKEYLLREAIDKTKKCFAMKEQELAMKKKLTLYAQKFDEFQETLAKSNEIYVRFKQEMDNMSEKMKQVEKESNIWKTRFENCNKALTDMIEERSEKGKEYELFVLKIQKLEKLCRALQEERKCLYTKIKEVRLSNAGIPSRLRAGVQDGPELAAEDKAALLTDGEIAAMQEDDPVLTEDMNRLRDEQAKLRDFAASLFATPFDRDEEAEGEEVDLEEDVVASAFAQFSTKAKKQEDSVREQSHVPPPEGAAHPPVQSADTPTAESCKEAQKPEEEVRAEQSTAPPPTQPEVQEETGEVKPAQDKKTQQQQIEDTPKALAPPTEDTPEVKPVEDKKMEQKTEDTPKALALPTEDTPIKDKKTEQKTEDTPKPLAPPTEDTPVKDKKTEQKTEDPPKPLAPPTEDTPVKDKKTEQKTEDTPKALAPPTENTPEVKPVEDKKTEQKTEDTPKALAPPTENTPTKKQAPKKKKKRNGKSAS